MKTATTEDPTSKTTNRQTYRRGFALVAGVALLATSCLSAEQSSATMLLNKDRSSARVSTLNTQQDAQLKAQSWADRLARENRLYHSTVSSGIGVRWCSLGENVGYASSISAAEALFMGSAIHRANIVSKTWNGVGVGVAHNGSRIFVVQVFIKTC